MSFNTAAYTSSPVAAAAQAAKAKRRAVIQRVRAQRAQAAKKTVAEWVQVGAIFRGSELKKRYHQT